MDGLSLVDIVMSVRRRAMRAIWRLALKIFQTSHIVENDKLRGGKPDEID